MDEDVKTTENHLKKWTSHFWMVPEAVGLLLTSQAKKHEPCMNLYVLKSLLQQHNPPCCGSNTCRRRPGVSLGENVAELLTTAATQAADLCRRFISISWELRGHVSIPKPKPRLMTANLSRHSFSYDCHLNHFLLGVCFIAAVLGFIMLIKKKEEVLSVILQACAVQTPPPPPFNRHNNWWPAN